MGDRVILHSDINSCYTSIELLQHPELRGKFVAVGRDPEARHGIVLIADYVAKKCGVKTRMALWQARQVRPDIIFVPPRMDLYLWFSKMAHEIYGEYTDLQEPYGTDESRAKTKFAKFFNQLQQIALFKASEDIQTLDMLNLPVPEVEYENVVLKPSEYQKDMVASLAERAEAVRDRLVQPYEDNMLKITNDGRKLVLDQRLINDMLPDDETSKASTCVEKEFEIWEQTKEQKSTQLIFCALSTPKGDGTFNVYEDIRNKLIEKGVPLEEIPFIHEANTELRKAELFVKVRSGQACFLLGSTQKMGAEPMCRTDLSHCTTLMCLGVRLM